MNKIKKPKHSQAMTGQGKIKFRKFLKEVKDKSGKVKLSKKQIDDIIGTDPEESRMAIATRFKEALQ